MKKKGLGKAICAVAVSAAMAVCLVGTAGCSSSSNSSSTQIAATVGDKTITEDEVTTYIENMRTSYSATEDSTWAMYLEYYFGSAKDLRTQVIDYLVSEKLVFIAAEEFGMSVSSDTIDGYVEQIKSNYSTDDEWKTALSNAGLTEDSYREVIEYNLLYQDLVDKFGVSTEPTDEEVLALAIDNVKYFDGMKRSSHILFSSDDQETAQSVLEQLQAGTLSWEDAVSEYSTDTTSAEADTPGDVGWTILNTFVTDYSDALANLAKGEMTSELVESTYGYHIIKCTDSFTAPSSLTSLDTLPSELTEFFQGLANTDTTSTNLSTWLDAFKTTQNVVINDMPEGLSYDIDVDAALASLYSTDDTSTDDTSTDDTSTTTTDTTSTTTTDSTTTDSSSSSTSTDSTTTTDSSSSSSSTSN